MWEKGPEFLYFDEVQWLDVCPTLPILYYTICKHNASWYDLNIFHLKCNAKYLKIWKNSLITSSFHQGLLRLLFTILFGIGYKFSLANIRVQIFWNNSQE